MGADTYNPNSNPDTRKSAEDFKSGYGVSNIGWQHPKMLNAMEKQHRKRECFRNDNINLSATSPMRTIRKVKVRLIRHSLRLSPKIQSWQSFSSSWEEVMPSIPCFVISTITKSNFVTIVYSKNLGFLYTIKKNKLNPVLFNHQPHAS